MMRTELYLRASAIALALALAACGDGKPAEQPKDAEPAVQETAEEGRTTIDPQVARNAGIKVETAGPAPLGEQLALNGRIEVAPEGSAEVHARYPGRVMTVSVQVGQRVSRGQVVARVESSESLQTYSVTAPISGLITAKNVNPGSITGGGIPMLTISDPSRIQAEFFLYPRDAERVRSGQTVTVQSLAGDHKATGTIQAILPANDAMSQTLTARVNLPYQDGVWRPGLGVSGMVTVGDGNAPVAVRIGALQPYEGKTAVFVRKGNQYEARPVKLGRQTAEWAEILEGLQAGEEYVTDGSFVLRADLEKAGASHDH
ncbi:MULTISPECIES: efflux RND transporter periplasmic adaptor subunit [unclassified Brevundimonas]|uniref:efflux RND transporter periplasmic adaptor subunit n=1 Tax=unclassified Brevundimonas TaxID=2622653 RepID=UPI0025C06B90|nr:MULTISPECIES: efflux RND transporter periplasmic adaptor subunit [unclassified Brevundimonas]